MKCEKSVTLYSMLTSLCGLTSSLVFGLAWYVISGIFHIAFFMTILPFSCCWCIAGIIAWYIFKTRSRLGIATYIFSILLFGLICIIIMTILDSSVKAWLILVMIGFFICSLPSYILLSYLLSK